MRSARLCKVLRVQFSTFKAPAAQRWEGIRVLEFPGRFPAANPAGIGTPLISNMRSWKHLPIPTLTIVTHWKSMVGLSDLQ